MSARTSSRDPDYELRVTAKDPDNSSTSQVGVAWTTQGPYTEFLSIRLDPGVVLDWRMCDDYFISLFPYKKDTQT